MDEADTVLNSEDLFLGNRSDISEKGELNNFLEGHGRRIIWISNRHNGINESSKRRFDMSIKFELPDRKQRKMLWEKICVEEDPKNKLGLQAFSAELSAHDMSPALIRSAVKNIVRYTKGKRKNKTEDILHTARHIINNQTDLLNIKSSKDEMSVDSSRYSTEALNTDINAAQILNCCRNWKKQHADKQSSLRNISLLLNGDPGCGKTEFSRYLAGQLGCELHEYKASELLSMWVGGTEQNIAKAFNEAQKKNAVLLIDEADSLLGDRSHAHQSWEVTQVNELLVQLEQFKGIVIMSTNFKTILDKASLRRFSFKVKFDAPKTEVLPRLFNRFFGSELPQKERMSFESACRELSGINFGDFKVVLNKLLLGQVQPTQGDLVNALKLELQGRKKKIVSGF